MFKHCKKVIPLIATLSSIAQANTNSFDLSFHNKMLSAEVATLFENSHFNVAAGFERHIDTGHAITLAGYKSHEVDIHSLGFGLQNINAWFKESGMPDSYTFAIYGNYRLEIVHGLHINTEAAFSPEIFTLNSELENYKMLSANIEYELMPDLELYTGYRYIHYNFDNNIHITFDENIYLGARFIF